MPMASQPSRPDALHLPDAQRPGCLQADHVRLRRLHTRYKVWQEIPQELASDTYGGNLNA
mgnify:CR=1